MCGARVNAWFAAVLQAAMGASSPIPQVRLWHLKRHSAKQATAGTQMYSLLEDIKSQMEESLHWLSKYGEAWNGISGMCGHERIRAIAAALKMDAMVSSPREIILTGLSTIDTYKMTWDMLLKHTVGITHKNFLAIQKMEDSVNAVAREAFYRAAYFYRGLSMVELEGICSGNMLLGPVYSFVSLSANPTIALEFAHYKTRSIVAPNAVLVIDSCRARSQGVVPAMYSMASDVLNLRRGAEGAERTFHMWNAFELQAHFFPKWPRAPSTMARAVITVSEPLYESKRLAKVLGVPCITSRDLFPASMRTVP